MNTKFLNDKLPKAYKFLVADESRNENNTLELAIDSGLEVFTKNSIIIRDENKGNVFMMFENYQEFAKAYPEDSDHLVHEYIMSWQPQKPKFDIDKCNEDLIDEIIADIHDIFYDTYGQYPDIITCNSSDNTIKSAHAIITNFCFKNTLEADWFTREVVLKQISADKSKFIDFGVNKPNQSFRTPYSTKKGRKKVPDGSDRFNTMITTTSNCIKLAPRAQPKTQPKTYKSIGNTKLYDYVDDQTWILYHKEGNRYDYHRLRPSHCDLCDRRHDNEHMFICVFDNKAIQYCRRNKSNSKVLYEIEDDFSNMYFGDYVKFLGKTPKYDHIVNWVKNNIVFILNGGNSYYVTRNCRDKSIRYDLTKNMKAIKDVRVEYKNPNYNAEDETSKKYIIDTLGNIINRMLTKIQYNYVEFLPYSPVQKLDTDEGAFNLFTGFKARYDSNMDIDMDYVQPWLDHIKYVLASEDETLYNYIVSWLAHIMQNPSKKIGTAILFKSKQGAGKNILFEFLEEEVIGESYAVTVNDIEQLVGRFNCTIENKILTICDEIQNYGGAYKSNDKLKSLITQGKQLIERKGIDAQPVNDFNNYIFLTNNDWPIKIEASDRRYVAIEPSNHRIGDDDYFNNLVKNKKAAAVHFYNWMLRYQTGVNLKKIPGTNLRNQLKMNSVPEPMHWLLQAIAGNIDNIKCDQVYTGNSLHTSFAQWSLTGGYRHNYTERSFLQMLNKITKSKVAWIDGKSVRGYTFKQDEILKGVREHLMMPDLDINQL